MKIPKIYRGFLNLTQKCNLKCKYCFVLQQPKEMTLETAIDAVNFYAKNALEEGAEPSFTLFGGEPMLKYEEIIVPLVEYVRENYGYYDIGITTNGTLLNREVYEFFKETDVGMLLSLDGMKEIQDYNRPYHSGKGSFDDIDIQMHLEYYPNGTFRATVDPDTAHMMYDNYLWGEEQGFNNCAFIPNVGGDWTKETIEAYKKEIDKIVDRIKSKVKEGKPYMRFNYLDNLNDQLDLIGKGYREQGKDRPGCGKCGIGCNGSGSIGSTGDIYSCQEMTENPEHDDFIIGNIYTGIDQTKIDEFSKFDIKEIRCENQERCKTCSLNTVCDGGCLVHNYYETGKLEIRPEVVCELDEYAFKKLREMEDDD